MRIHSVLVSALLISGAVDAGRAADATGGRPVPIAGFDAGSVGPKFDSTVVYDATKAHRRVHEPTVIEGSPGTMVLGMLDYPPIGRKVPGDMDSENTVLFMRSTDGGRTWDKANRLGSDYSINPGFIRAPKGDLWLFFDRKNSDVQDDNSLSYCHSSDNGLTWSEPIPVSIGHRVHLLANNGILLRNGDMLIDYLFDRGNEAPPYDHAKQDYVSAALISSDAGRTWRSFGSVEIPNQLGLQNARSFAAEGAPVQTDDGIVHMFLRTRSHYLFESASGDGRTWSDAKPMRFSNPDSKPMTLKLKDGNVLLLWNNTQVFDYAAKRFPLMASLSEDGGKTWPFTVTVSDDRVPLHYPTAIEFGGNIDIFYGWNYEQIRMVRLTEGDLKHHWTAINKSESWVVADGVAAMRDDQSPQVPEKWSKAGVGYPWTDWTKLVSFLPAKPVRYSLTVEFRWDGDGKEGAQGAIGIFSGYQDEDNWMGWVCRPVGGSVGIERQEHFGLPASVKSYWNSEKTWLNPFQVEAGVWYEVRIVQGGSGIKWELKRSGTGEVMGSGSAAATYPGNFLAVGTLGAKASFRNVKLASLAAGPDGT